MDIELVVSVDNDNHKEDVELNDSKLEERDGDTNEKSGFLVIATEERKKADVGVRSKLCSDKDVRHKYIHTVCVALSLMASGWRMSIVGPSLPDLRLIINENLSRASWIVSAIALGGLVGSLCGGVMYDRLNKYVIFIGLTFTLAVASVVTPWCSTFGSMVAIHALNGACAWGIDTVAAADVVFVWREKSAPFLQAVNFAYSLGAMISPVTAKPFFAERQSSLTVSTSTPRVLASNTSTVNELISNVSMSDVWVNSTFADQISNLTNGYDGKYSLNNLTGILQAPGNGSLTYGQTRIHFAFLIAGLISLLTCLTFVFQYWFFGSVHKLQIKKTSKEAPLKHYPLSKNWQICFVVILASILSTYCTSERLFYSYLMTFLIDKLKWNKTDGASATTVFWTAFTVGRLVSVFIVRRLKMLCIFVVFLGTLFAGACVMLVAVRIDNSALVWVSCGLHGLGLSALFASFVNWIPSKVCSYTGTVSSTTFCIVIVGAMVYPLIVGNVMSSVSYDWFIYLEIILTSFMAILIAFAEILYRFLTKHKNISK